MENNTQELSQLAAFMIEQRVKRDEARQKRLLDMPLSETDLVLIRAQAESNIDRELTRTLAIQAAVSAMAGTHPRPKARKPHSKQSIEYRVQLAVFAAVREGKPHKAADIARTIGVDRALLSRGKGKRAYLEAVALATRAARSVARPDGGQDDADDSDDC